MKEIIKSRISALRQLMKEKNIDAVIIPQADPHQSEYLSDHWQLLRRMSGFTGSAATLVVTAAEALLWTDSRYFLQAAEQLDGTGIQLMKDGLLDTPSIENHLISSLKPGSTVGIDGMLFSVAATDNLRKAFNSRDIELNVAFPIADLIWTDGRPPLPTGKIFHHDIKYSGCTTAEKLKAIRTEIAAQGADATLISALDEIAWALNIRCNDVSCNPVATSFLYVGPHSATLFIDASKVDDDMLHRLADDNITIAPYESAQQFVTNAPDSRILLDMSRTSGRMFNSIGAKAVAGQSPVAFHKACRNAVQIEGTRRAMERDGVALVKSFMEIERRLASGEPTTELDIADILKKHRSAQPLYFDESFSTIAGFGPHGAIVHYSATPESNADITPGNLLLIDSGAQYFDGTTDITRTIAIGEPDMQQKTDFTLVLKGHIALARAIYPEGTRGAQLDVLARQFLWQHGLNYLHGTGHGVGHFLNVHEGPQSIRLNDVPATLRPGMVTSDEPGLYRAGAYGIRCENLVLTTEAFTTDDGRFLKFETLTLFPFDLSLCLPDIMTDDEIQWLNHYHSEVFRRLSPLLDSEERAWLASKTPPLTR